MAVIADVLGAGGVVLWLSLSPVLPPPPPVTPGATSGGTVGIFKVEIADLLGTQRAPGQQSSASQEPSRQQSLLDQRRQRAAEVEPASYPSWTEWLVTMENVGVSEIISWQIRNVRIGWGKLTPVSGLAPTIRFEIPRIANSQLKAYIGAGYSISGYQNYAFQFGFLDEPAPSEISQSGYIGPPFDWDNRSQKVLYKYLYLTLQYDNSPQEEFFGLGDASLEENRSTYRYEQSFAGLAAGWQVARWLGIQGRAGYLAPNVGSGTNSNLDPTEDLFDEGSAPGLTEQPDFTYFAAGIYGGRAGDPGQPIVLAGTRFERFNDTDGDRFDYSTIDFDARAYLPLGARNRVIAARFYTLLSYPNSGSDVPFYLMRYLGGNQTLRGFRNFRFRDGNQVYVSAEYRWEAASGVEAAFFYDTGKVFADRSEWGFDGLRDSYGFGVRGKSWLKTVFRIDIGRSSEGTFVWFAFGPTF